MKLSKTNTDDTIQSQGEIYIACGLKESCNDYIKRLDLGKTIGIVSDQTTFEVLGEYIEKKLQSDFEIHSILLPKEAKADISNVRHVKQFANQCDFLLAVGSGSINDIAKYASFELEKPYAVWGTAPSMNGYASSNASITINGHKKTVKAIAPKAIYLDLNVLVEAPVRLIRSGVGDSLCRPTAQADWLLSHCLLNTEYNPKPFEMLRPFEKELFANSSGLVRGDKEIVKLLAETLIQSGIGMNICQGSYPASQAEHMVAHTMDMAFGAMLPKTFHGEQIGVTTLMMAEKQSECIEREVLLDMGKYPADELNVLLGKAVVTECREEYEKKYISVKKHDELEHQLKSSWQSIANTIHKVIVPYDTLYKVLEAIGAPKTPGALGWKSSDFEKACKYAKYTRSRFTFLDLKTSG